MEGLQQRAGVTVALISRLVLKELADNGLDAGARVTVAPLSDAGGYAVEDDGPGFDGEPEDVASLFSIGRPMRSSKLLRLPTRGALGNGLRVVAGAVLSSGGSLTVTTRNRRIRLQPERDGTTTVTDVEAADCPIGTRIEVRLGPAIPCDQNTLHWAKIACHLAHLGTPYLGASSPWWYDAAQFMELLYASGATSVRELIGRLDGCSSDKKAGEIVERAGLKRTICRDVTASQAAQLLEAARDNTKPVNAKRLGAVGPQAFPSYSYAVRHGVTRFGAAGPQAEIPFAVETWVQQSTQAKTLITACVNRTPVTGDLRAARDKRDIDVFGCGLAHTIARAPTDTKFDIWLNVTTPYMPITSDGKAPDLRPFLEEIRKAVSRAVRQAHRPESGAKVSIKDVVLDNLDDVIAEVSGDGRYRFNARQILYRLRPIVKNELQQDLSTGHFSSIITDYEDQNGEIDGMYREPRGSIYHPHRRETITLGTLMVENYERPPWTFNKLIYIEKEGFSEALKDERWAEKHDCALLSSKGFTTRAARDLVDLLAEHDEPVTVFCVHDADAFGTLIYETLQNATRARGARKIQIINLGLDPWEALELDLEVETIKEGDRRKPVAEYVTRQPCEEPEGGWEEWLQVNRVELNAMSTPEFIAWLDKKMAFHGRLVPPAGVLAVDLGRSVEEKVRIYLTDRILREAGIDGQVAAAVAAIEKPSSDALTQGIENLFRRMPDSEWRDHIEAIARDLAQESAWLSRSMAPTRFNEVIEFVRAFKGTPGRLSDWWRNSKTRRAAMTPEERCATSEAFAAKILELIVNDEF